MHSIYKIIFNFFAKKDGFSASTHLIAGSVMSLLIFVSVLNVAAIISFCVDRPFNFNLNKGSIWSFVLLYIAFTYYLWFELLKFEKKPADALLFRVDPATEKLFWVLFFVNWGILLIVCVIKLIFNI